MERQTRYDVAPPCGAIIADVFPGHVPEDIGTQGEGPYAPLVGPQGARPAGKRDVRPIL